MWDYIKNQWKNNKMYYISGWIIAALEMIYCNNCTINDFIFLVFIIIGINLFIDKIRHLYKKRKQKEEENKEKK